jgi:hypothetical protein
MSAKPFDPTVAPISWVPGGVNRRTQCIRWPLWSSSGFLPKSLIKECAHAAGTSFLYNGVRSLTCAVAFSLWPMQTAIWPRSILTILSATPRRQARPAPIPRSRLDARTKATNFTFCGPDTTRRCLGDSSARTRSGLSEAVPMSTPTWGTARPALLTRLDLRATASLVAAENCPARRLRRLPAEKMTLNGGVISGMRCFMATRWLAPNGRPLCVAAYGESVQREFNPLSTDTDDMIEEQSRNTAENLDYFLKASAGYYAMHQGLVKPLASPVVRGLLADSELAGKASRVITMVAVGCKLIIALVDNIELRRDGGCYASFLPPSMQ